MRTVSQCLRLKSSYAMTSEERVQFHEWLDKEARYMYESVEYCELLGWYLLDDMIPLSPKEAGFD